mmetsp:Transcript_17013/g.40093  ORF Transcript_17013/g.40093 Transcript_17013/m.40093 type:complete len:706 (-) Transcript_17013:28-2145(-)
MPRKAQVLFRRWFHHRTRTEYRELSDAATKEESNLEKMSLWTTVPGLIVEDDDGFLSVEDDDAAIKVPNPKMGSNRREILGKDSLLVGIGGNAQDLVERVSRSESFETLETEEESDLAEHNEHSRIRTPTIRWADQLGVSLAEKHEIEVLPPLNVRVVILMLNPGEKFFEFVQCEFQTDERLTVSDLLAQLPFMASMEALKKQRYTALYRGEREMVNIISIQDYNVAEGEILVAVAAGFNPRQSVAAASALLLQRSLLRAVQKAKLSGRALQKLMSSQDLATVLDGEDPSVALAPVDLDDESHNDPSQLVIRVLDKELGIRSKRTKEDAGVEDEKKEEYEPSVPCEDEPLPFASVPELDDGDFDLFHEAIRIDPYSPVARGRMSNLPEHFLSEELSRYDPPFGTIEEEDSDAYIWSEVSSAETDDEEEDDVEPIPVESNLSSDGDEDPQEILRIQEQYVGTATFFADASDTDDDDDDDDYEAAPVVNTNRDGGYLVLEPPSPMESSAGCSELTGTDFSDDETECDFEDDEFEPIPEIHDENDIEPVPTRLSGHIASRPKDRRPLSAALTNQEPCELSRISEVDTLDENTTLSHKPSEETGAISEHHGALPQVPVFDDDLSNMTESEISDVPEIEESDSSSTGSATEADKAFSMQRMSPSKRAQLINETAAYYAAGELFVGAVYKLASVATRSNKNRREYLEEAEV